MLKRYGTVSLINMITVYALRTRTNILYFKTYYRFLFITCLDEIISKLYFPIKCTELQSVFDEPYLFIYYIFITWQ